MEPLLEKAWGLILALVSSLAGLFIYFQKRNASEVRQVAKELSQYKEFQARETELHRTRMNMEMAELKAKLEGVTVALSYINNNLSGIAEILREKK